MGLSSAISTTTLPAQGASGAAATTSHALQRAKRELERIPDDFLAMVKERADVVRVIGARVILKKAGAGYTGLCPFHKERSPSFTVSPVRNTYHCFGCGAHGNPLSFLIEYEGQPFRDAVRELAGELGLSFPEGMEPNAPKRDLSALYDAMTLAQRFFLHVLRESDPAKQYLKGRGLEARMLERYAIGFAPDEWRGLKEAFADYEQSDVLVQAGLVKEKELEATADRPAKVSRYDLFRGRITFGVRDTRGRLVAFGARALGDGEPKYLNSPETPIFDKSGALFGLYEAKDTIRTLKEAVVVEGYMDVIMLAQHGVTHAVASMGTAFTRWHLERLLTQTSRVIFCFDGDKAGQEAAWKALQTCAGMLEDEHDFRFMVLPDGLDPDEFVQKHGGKAFSDLIAAAPAFTEFLFITLQQRHGLAGASASSANAETRARFAAEAAEVANKISYRVRLRKIVMDQIAQEAKVPGSAVAAIRSVEATRARKPANLWGVFAQAMKIAPATALSVREELTELLALDDPEEAAFAHALEQINADAVDLDAHPDYLASQDLLNSGIDRILEHRHKQLREALAAQLAAGEITNAEFFKLRKELGV